MLIGLANLLAPVAATLMVGAGIGAVPAGKSGAEIPPIMAQVCRRAQELQGLMQMQNVLQQSGHVVVRLEDEDEGPDG